MSNLKTLILRKSHSKKQHKITGLYIFKNTKVDKVMHKGEGGGGLANPEGCGVRVPRVLE